MPCSIIIPTKDRPAGLLQAVRSALSALPPGGEIVVVDDGSKIPAGVLLVPLACAALRIVSNPGPNGPSGARNHGVSQAQHPVIFFLDDDDVLLPNYCRTILNVMGDLPVSTGYGFSAAFVKSPNGPDRFKGMLTKSGTLPDNTPLDERLTGLGTGFWIRRELFALVGGLDPALQVNEDTELSIRLAAAGVRAYYHNRPGVLIFQDPVRDEKDRKSITQSADAVVRAAAFEYILRKQEDFLRNHGNFRRKCMMRVIKYRRRARKVEGWNEFCSSLRPTLENRLIWAHGWVWLRLSIAARGLRRKR